MKRFSILLTLLCFSAVLLSPATSAPPTDDDIQAAIRVGLLRDAHVWGKNVEIAVEDGIATLTGEVPSLRAKDRVALLASTRRGVRAVVNQVEIAFAQVDDDALAERITKRLKWDPVLQHHDLKTSVDAGAVTLEGQTPSHEIRQLAREAVAAIPGVREVTNRLTINPKGNRSDEEIRFHVIERWESDPYLPTRHLRLEVDQGRVRALGKVGSEWQRQRAQRLAYVHGVQHVDSSGIEMDKSLLVDSVKKGTRQPPEDDAIRQAIEDALATDPTVFGPAIEVRVAGGKVTLQGQAPTLAAKTAAGAIATNASGVSDVFNHLALPSKSTSSSQTDASLSKATVTQALNEDPATDNANLTVTIDGNTVTLAGTVETPLIRQQAQRVVSGIPGVHAIINQLSVRRGSDWILQDDIIGAYPDFQLDDTPHIYLPSLETDDSIARSLQEEFQWNILLNDARIDVTVEEGNVNLQGTVGDHVSKRLAERLAWKAGAKSVSNNLETTPPGNDELTR